jgi:hypothetical protein
VRPTQTTRRAKSTAAKQRAALPLRKWKIKDWERVRFQNPYSSPPNPRWTNLLFRNDFQMKIISDIFEHHKNKVTKMWSVDLVRWRNNPAYFGEALEICEEFDLIKIMELNCDFDVELVHQFYATVHFGDDDQRHLSFMCRDEFFCVPWASFCNALGYEDTGPQGQGGLRPHDRAHPMDKIKLAPLYIPGHGIVGKSNDLLPVYDILHRVFRCVLLPKVGNQDDIYGYLVDLLVAMKTKRGKGITFDVSKWLFEEMYNCVWYRKVPIYAPFVMRFLYTVWDARRPGEPLTTPDKLTEHEVKVFRMKKHAAPRYPEGNPEDVYATSSDEDFELESGAKPSWVDKLTSKIKKTFCLQVHIQKKLYKAHVAEKMAHRRQIQMMRHCNVPGAESGSEKVITPEDKWCLENCQWSDDEPSTSAARAPEDTVDPEAMEESVEAEESDEDGSDDSLATGEELY